MVKICTEETTPLEPLDTNYPFELSFFQKSAITAIQKGESVLVTAHTGSGKTLPAEYGIEYWVSKGKKVVYTSPIKALSNQKFHEFTNKYPDISFGLLTGDIKYNPEAEVLIMTTEILRNTLFQKTILSSSEKPASALQFDMDLHSELSCVIFDEVHYINDPSRGKVWEESIMMLPNHVQLIMLSATIDTPSRFAAWVEQQNPTKEVWLCSTSDRVVPLKHYMFITMHDSMFDKIGNKDQRCKFQNINNEIRLLKSKEVPFQDLVYHGVKDVKRYMDKNRVYVKRSYAINKVVKQLQTKDMLPAICFVFSRKGVEQCASEITHSLIEETSTHSETVENECKKILLKLPNYREYMQLPEYLFMIKLLKKGVAIHHSGVLPILREMVEMLFSKGYIRMLFATETFAVGINMPTKTVVFSSFMKYDGHTERMLQGHEYTQMAGRAGRRGMDTVGYVIHMSNLSDLPSLVDYKKMLKGAPQKLTSKFTIHYNLLLNLLRSNNSDMLTFMNRSMNQESLQNQLKSIQSQMELVQEEQSLFVPYYKLTIDETILEKYIALQDGSEYQSSNQRKGQKKELYKLRAAYASIDNESNLYKKMRNYKETLGSLKQNLKFIESYNAETIHIFMDILYTHGFISIASSSETKSVQFKDDRPWANTNNTVTLTEKGLISIGIQEWNGVVAAEFLRETNYLEEMAVIDIIKLFSCFTNIRVSDDVKTGYKLHRFTGSALEKHLDTLNLIYNKYNDIEIKYELTTGLEYEIHYDLLPYIEDWIKSSDESSCAKVLRSLEADKKIFVGEFVKALLKIHTVGLELEKIAEDTNHIDLLVKLREIPNVLLKYIVNTQSLYI
jgi:superfamily II RNA helicase